MSTTELLPSASSLATTDSTAEPSHSPFPILFFDGDCGFCNGWVQFLLRIDRRQILTFAPLQGETAARLLPVPDVANLSSVVYMTPNGLLRESDAIFQLARDLGGVWGVLGWCGLGIPRVLRNAGYRFVARNRYRLAGKVQACQRPTDAQRARFLP